MKAVLFDLDDTLVESSSLRDLRAEQKWGEVEAALDGIRAYRGAAELLSSAKAAGCKTGIVTSAPRWYAERLIASHGFAVDVVVAAGDYNYGKPGPEPIKKAFEQLGVHNTATLAIGDRCVDTASGRTAGVNTLGAKWGAANHRDLILSYPYFMASSPDEAKAVMQEWLSSTPPKPYSWFEPYRHNFVWRKDPSGDHRQHLSGVHSYTHARFRYKGAWHESHTNSLVKSFKAKALNQRFFKQKAAALFCMELASLVPANGYVTYVLPSTKKGEEGYDDRWELLAELLLQKGIRSIWPLQIKQSTPASHTLLPDSEYREPDFVESNLEWLGALPSDCKDLYLIDDVLTKGGHMRGYADFIKKAYPDVSVHCVAWALHTSAPWHASR